MSSFFKLRVANIGLMNTFYPLQLPHISSHKNVDHDEHCRKTDQTTTFNDGIFDTLKYLRLDSDCKTVLADISLILAARRLNSFCILGDETELEYCSAEILDLRSGIIN